jgi:hypothetical protein
MAIPTSTTLPPTTATTSLCALGTRRFYTKGDGTAISAKYFRTRLRCRIWMDAVFN